MARVVLTGAGGFVGANLLRHCMARGDEVHAVVRAASSAWRLPESGFHRHAIDLCNADAVKALVREARPEVVLHFAAHTAVPVVTDEMAMLVHTVGPLMNLATACTEIGGCEVFVNAGSSSEYGYQTAPMGETSLPSPSRIHDIAKLAQTHYATSAARFNGLPVVTLRLFSVYGPFEHGRRLIPRLVRAALRGDRVALSTPAVARDFIHVDDVVAAVDVCRQGRRFSGEVFNLGTGIEHSLRDVVAKLEEIHGSPLPVDWGNTPRQRWDSPRWVADTTMQETQLGFKARTLLSDGLRRTYDWFRDQGLAMTEYGSP